jgi:hypothetical protein
MGWLATQISLHKLHIFTHPNILYNGLIQPVVTPKIEEVNHKRLYALRKTDSYFFIYLLVWLLDNN